MIYPIVIHKDPETAYGVTVPDLPGRFSAGETQRINISMAERILTKVDTFAKNSNKTRSRLLADAVLEYIAVHSEDNISV